MKSSLCPQSVSPVEGIVTHPFRGNYGGMLQCCALHRVLASLGIKAALHVGPKVHQHDSSWLIDAPFRHIRDWIRFRLGIRSKKNIYLKHQMMRAALQFRLSQLPATIDAGVSDAAFRAYIVGSDQVWRGKYARYIETLPYFFLDFASPEQRSRSIAYAASFGTDEWEGTPEETEQCRQYLREFKAVSVREHSGVRLCREIFGVEAVQMPDPTLLLEPQAYDEIINSANTDVPAAPYIAAYVLDPTRDVRSLVEQIANTDHLELVTLQHDTRAKKLKDRIPRTPAQWLRSIRDARLMITDSFHGCVFSILYNIPFVCLGNAKRGSSRFESLFETFGLQDRLTTSSDPRELSRLLHSPVDWDCVNRRLAGERARGIDFLRENLAV